MLLWEILAPAETNGRDKKAEAPPRVAQRLPFDRRCSALTRSGRRCRGRIRNTSEFCVFHDPEVAAKRRQQQLRPRAAPRRRLSHLPDGYLRKLSSRRAVGEGMDRLYREVRLGLITPEMGNVLFAILTRLLDAGLVADPVREGAADRSRAGRLRPKLAELLTRAERAAWRKAIASAPEHVVRGLAAAPDAPERAASTRPSRPQPPDMAPLPLPAAS